MTTPSTSSAANPSAAVPWLPTGRLEDMSSQLAAPVDPAHAPVSFTDSRVGGLPMSQHRGLVPRFSGELAHFLMDAGRPDLPDPLAGSLGGNMHTAPVG
jgi:hypothetical protein